MEFTKSLIKGKLIKRYKRFFTDVRLQKKTVTAHCANTGSMKGLLDEGNEVYLLKHNDPKRKLKYGLEIIKAQKNLVGINTHMANKIANHGLSNNLIKELKNNDTIKPEVYFNKDTRFDFFVQKKNKGCFIEVKNVTMSRNKNTAEFPDAVTDRGSKHLKELVKAKRRGFEAYLAFVIQREDCKIFKIANDIDTKYKELLTFALKNKLKVICYDCKFLSKGIIINKRVKFIN